MPTYRYQLSGSLLPSPAMPDLSLVSGFTYQFATDQNVSENQLTTYKTTLDGQIIRIVVTANNGIPDAIRAEAQRLLFTGTPAPMAGTPIVDVVVNPSEPSGQIDIWRTDDDLYIHPLSNQLTMSGSNKVTIAPRNVSGDLNHAVSARVAATRIYP